MLEFYKFLFRNSIRVLGLFGLLYYFGFVNPIGYYILKYDPNDRLGLIKGFDLKKEKAKEEDNKN